MVEILELIQTDRRKTGANIGLPKAGLNAFKCVFVQRLNIRSSIEILR